MNLTGENPQRASDAFRRYGLAAAIVLAGWLAYVGCAHVPFLFDDRPAIERNASLQHLWPLTTPLQPPVTAAGAAGRPITNLSLALNYAAGGLDPNGYHWFNLALHLAVALALFGVLRRTFQKIDALHAANEGLAAGITLIWVVHPLTTEAVVCVVQRNELLATLFLLLTLYSFIRAASTRGRSGWLSLSVACCLLGMASKETMAGAPLLVLLYDRTFVAGNFRDALRTRRWFYGALAGTWLLLAFLVTQHEQRAGTVGFGLGTSAWDYLVTQCRALALYLKLSFWPRPLVLDYGFEIAPGLGAVWPQAVLVVALLGATMVGLVRRPAWGLVGAVFFIVLAPSSSFVPLTTQTIAEHRMYFPLALVITAVAVAGFQATRRHSFVVPAGLALALGMLTFERVEVYQDEARIWRDTIAQVPNNPRAHDSLANVLVREGRWEEALPLFREALRLQPDYADAQNDCANVLRHLGRTEEALAHYEAARRLKPDDDDIRYNLAAARVQLGRLAEAIQDFRALVARNPRNLSALNALGDARLKTGEPAEALAAFATAAAVDPTAAAAQNNLGIALVTLGRFAEAVPHYEIALQQFANSAQVHHNLALALHGAGRLRDAIAQEETALRLDPSFAPAREHLEQLRAADGGAR